MDLAHAILTAFDHSHLETTRLETVVLLRQSWALQWSWFFGYDCFFQCNFPKLHLNRTLQKYLFVNFSVFLLRWLFSTSKHFASSDFPLPRFEIGETGCFPKTLKPEIPYFAHMDLAHAILTAFDQNHLETTRLETVVRLRPSWASQWSWFFG